LEFSPKKVTLHGVITIKKSNKANVSPGNTIDTTFEYFSFVPDSQICINGYEPNFSGNNRIANLQLIFPNILDEKKANSLIGKHVSVAGYLDATPFRNNPTIVRLHVVDERIFSSH
jgi:hypothetical protein